MKHITIYINTACSNCQKALTILNDLKIHAEQIEYLKSPLNNSDLNHIIDLGIPPAELVRVKEKAWQELNLEIESISRQEIIEILTQQPSLLQRPIVVTKDKAIIARPPEKILEIL